MQSCNNTVSESEDTQHFGPDSETVTQNQRVKVSNFPHGRSEKKISTFAQYYAADTSVTVQAQKIDLYFYDPKNGESETKNGWEITGVTFSDGIKVDYDPGSDLEGSLRHQYQQYVKVTDMNANYSMYYSLPEDVALNSKQNADAAKKVILLAYAFASNDRACVIVPDIPATYRPGQRADVVREANNLQQKYAKYAVSAMSSIREVGKSEKIGLPDIWEPAKTISQN